MFLIMNFIFKKVKYTVEKSFFIFFSWRDYSLRVFVAATISRQLSCTIFSQYSIPINLKSSFTPYGKKRHLEKKRQV